MNRTPTLAFLALLPFSACTCGAPDEEPKDSPVGTLEAVTTDEGFELSLSNLERPVRMLQVDVRLEGAFGLSATSVSTDLVEANLTEPKDDFTVVVADTRRLNLPAGTVARIATGEGLTGVALSGAIAVDDSGAKRLVTVVTP